MANNWQSTKYKIIHPIHSMILLKFYKAIVPMYNLFENANSDFNIKRNN